MNVISRYLQELKAVQMKMNEAAVKPPAEERNAFGYGRACGRAEGLKMAEELLDRVLKDNERGEY